MTKVAETKTVNISAHVPLSLAENLSKVSKFEERSKSYYIQKSLEQLLKEKLEDIEDYIEAEKAYEEFIDSGEKAVPLEKVFKNMK